MTETASGLIARLAEFERRIAAAVAARRRQDDHADDPFRGLYLSDEAVDTLLTTPRTPFEAVLPHPSPDLGGLVPETRNQTSKISDETDRLGWVAGRAGLNGLDVDLLLVALAPDVDSRFEQFYGYLNDDVTRRRATVGLALRLCGLPEASVAGRVRLDAAAPLVAAALLTIDETDRPFLSRTLRVPDRVVAYLLGDDRPDPLLAGLVDISAAPGSGHVDGRAVGGALVGGGHVNGRRVDAAHLDAASLDAASFDAASVDAAAGGVGTLDAASFDAASFDAAAGGVGTLDAAAGGVGTLDAAAVDAASVDAAAGGVGTVDAAAGGVGTVDAASLYAATLDAGTADGFARALCAGVRLAHVRQRPGSGARELAALAAGRAGYDVVCVDPGRLAVEADLATVHRALLREAVLRGAALVVGPLASTTGGSFEAGPADGPHDGRGTEPLVRALRHPAVPLITFGPESWDPRWSDEPPLQVEALPLLPYARAGLWRAQLNGKLAVGTDPLVATAHFVLDPHQIARAARAAALFAMADGGAVDAVHMAAGARTQNASGLQRLARRIEPGVTWTDLVLPAQVLSLLRELTARAQFRDRVLDEWRMRPGGGRGRGVAGLFAGDSGTGKTMSAEVIAASLGMDLYTVNLASVVSKYIGETEKNLERIFAEAAGTNGVLLFDEADAIFGKRSEVKDAHDRYANIESAYLLQRMETFDGIALLATNLRANLDEAFTRRLDVVVDFPMPDGPLRERLWDRCLASGVPRADGIDLGFLAHRFELAGGHIRSAAVTAAYLAAQAGRSVSMIDLVGAVAREYRKLGRLCLESEFGEYLVMIEEVASLPTP